MKEIKNLSQYFDHTILKAEATEEDIKKLCAEAKAYGFYSVCVNGCYVSLAAEELKDSDVKVAAVVGFPLGAAATEVKAFETDWACEQGASEIDMVINVGALKEGRYEYVKDDILSVVGLAYEHNAIVKVILETCLLTDEEVIKACELSMEAGADFVKTSTGFSTGGATEHHVALMRETVGLAMKVKASGGIRDLGTTLKMIEAGADRIGASASVGIVKEYNQ
ncbi:deoxyribose-phosphate aldolase [Clostridium aminobutyricum]|uniref:Deoxyribose-phosphate aldolase n=1 Tax=Clostridium aminobutyricum TaxID=33953 RepID=A0A939DAI9_CLOAM|nr:deoxyribose-phosphate aldolase [Clostridium aminobutyricum]MBN7774256.1 deoxyribose-phosphate aldolase [Clostridium aminobutyricum]